MKTKTLIAMFLSGVLALSLAGCNDPIEKEPDIVEPGNGNGDDGNDDGGNDDGGNNGLIDPSTGTWENKDEDGDGVLDENDDFPFDQSKTRMVLHLDNEPNNSHLSTNNDNVPLPIRVEGVISEQEDKDTYKFTVSEPAKITLILHSNNSDFNPNAFILGFDNASLTAYKGIMEPTGSLRFIATYDIKQAGTYNLSVSDFYYRGTNSYSYDAQIFVDQNVNGIPDSIEPAIGIHDANSNDQDNDGGKDALEYYVYKYDRSFDHDVDADNVPNWLDDDSDNDGISDSLEGSIDDDFDGKASRFDLDSDNDGKLDSVSSGIERLKDTDFDAIPDYRDIDDDGDKLLDENDLEPMKMIESYKLSDSNYVEITRVAYNYIDQFLIPNMVFENKVHFAQVDGNATSGFLVIETDTSVVNIPVTHSNSGYRFKLPYKAKSIFFSNGQFKTNTVQVSPLLSGHVMITDEQQVLDQKVAKQVNVGDTLELRGVGFQSGMQVLIDDIEHIPNVVDSEHLTLNINNSMSSGTLQLKTTYGLSNPIDINVVNAKEVAVDEPFSTIPSNLVFKSSAGSNHVISDGMLVINSQGLDYTGYYVSFLTGELEEDYPFFIYLEGVDNRVSPLHFAVSEIWAKLRPDRVLTKEDAVIFYNEVIENEETIALANQIALLFDSPKRLNVYDANYEVIFELALEKARAQFSEMKQSSVNYSRFTSSTKYRYTNTVKSNKTDTVGHPIISSDWNIYQDKIDIKAPKQFNSIREGYVYTGNLDVDNDKKLMLSAEFSLADNLGDPAQKLIPHIDSYFHKDIIGPQSWGILNLSTRVSFAQCEYKDCVIDVITPGFLDPQPPMNDIETQRILAARMAVEQLLIPLLSHFIDNSEFFKDKEFRKALIKETYNYVKLHFDVSNSTSSGDKFLKVVDSIRDDLWRQGPVYQLVSSKVAGNLIANVSKQAALWIAKSFIPVYGQAEKIVEALININLANDLAQYAHDMFTVPGHIRYTVEWPVAIYGLDPELVDKETITGHLPVTIHGKGFVTQTFWLGNFSDLPNVYIFDGNNPDDVYFIDINKDAINQDATEISILIPEEFVSSWDEIGVRVIVEDHRADAPRNIMFGSGLKISKITPNHTSVGETVSIEGIGFSPVLSANKVTFKSSNGRVLSSVMEASKNQLTVTVPNGAVSGEVIVEINGIQSNPYPVNIVTSGITIAFGDNGNLQDDNFAISVAGDSVELDTVGQRRKEHFKELNKGVYSVTLTGEKVPDERGTFFICFSDNVLVKSGPSQTSKTAITKKGDTLSWIVEIGEGDSTALTRCSFVNSVSENVKKEDSVKILWDE